ncbi:MAG TPA: hypothetical protein DDX54_03335 [Rhodospirillaceae bacterium]|jgi:hypothetical protein|nr:hypothetical protein [Alphaproteobacteria bacterium]HBH26418.1 hypothetical protein [Rhodospirillaceae bacterium]
MNYTFFAIGLYIALRATQVLLEHAPGTWPRKVIVLLAALTLYAAVASLIVWFSGDSVYFLGFDPK